MTDNSSSCNLNECEMTFSNKDHLEWNQKKHDMMLNLELSNKNPEGDQTPTPTRFIRNCEEVGLFQDLQNVNPFDEVFKKAVENPTSVSLQVPVSSADDTLHTPQIYPALEDNSNITDSTYSLNNVIPGIEEVDDTENPLIIVSDTDNEECNNHSKANMKNKVKTALREKATSGITPVPIYKLKDPQTSGNSKNKKVTVELLRQREANKAAQNRCRKRKQMEFEQMKSELRKLRHENSKLMRMNLHLQETVKKLEIELKDIRPTHPVLTATPFPPTSEQTNVHKIKENSIKLPHISPEPSIATHNVTSVPIQNIQGPSNSTIIVIVNSSTAPNNSVVVPSIAPILPFNSESDSRSKSDYKKIVPKCFTMCKN